MSKSKKILSFAESGPVGARAIESLRKPEKINVTVRLEKPLHSRISSLIDRTDASNTQDVIRQGLVVYEALISEAELGKDIMIVDPSDASNSYPLFARE